MADIAPQSIDDQTEDVPPTIEDLLANIEQLQELNQLLLCACEQSLAQWQGFAPKHPLCKALKAAIAKAYGNE
jgi:hypothetical protein